MTRVLNASAPTWQRVGVLQRGKIFHFRPCLAVLSSRHIAHVKWVKLNVSFTVKLASALIICPSGNIFWVHSIDQRSRIIGLMLPATLTQCFLIKESQKKRTSLTTEVVVFEFSFKEKKKKEQQRNTISVFFWPSMLTSPPGKELSDSLQSVLSSRLRSMEISNKARNKAS